MGAVASAVRQGNGGRLRLAPMYKRTRPTKVLQELLRRAGVTCARGWLWLPNAPMSLGQGASWGRDGQPYWVRSRHRRTARAGGAVGLGGAAAAHAGAVGRPRRTGGAARVERVAAL
eukprot:scaffold67752_cov48-Phaeocystis_antarctica.AAC.2